MDKNQRIEELVSILNQASKSYYGGSEESMSNYEWDEKYDELAALEAETGYILQNSPTQNVGYEDNNHEPKDQHEFPPLSLAKTKDVHVLQKWEEDKAVWLSWKLDDKYISINYIPILLTRLREQRNKPLCIMFKTKYG